MQGAGYDSFLDMCSDCVCAVEGDKIGMTPLEDVFEVSVHVLHMKDALARNVKSSNIKRHYETKHFGFDKAFPQGTQERKINV